MESIRNIPKNAIEKFENLGINTKSKRFFRHYKRGYLNEIDEDFIKEVHEYYKENFGKIIDPVSHIAFSNFTGIKEVRIVPESNFRKDFLWFFNDRPMTDAYLDKNINDFYFRTNNQAYTVVKRVRGHYFDHFNNEISKSEVIRLLINDSEEYIIKPSDTNNGIDINKLKIIDDKVVLNNREVNLEDLEDIYGFNFLIQRIISQHENMSMPHPDSVNTLRMVTLRWNGEIHNLYTFARFGVNNDVKDNAGAGGLSVGVKEDGSFMEYGIVRLRKVQEHPTTNIKITEFKSIPNYSKAKDFVRELHRNILHHDYVSWDIAIDKNGEPILIESNFFGTSFLNQIALARPTFGNMTEDILKYIRDNSVYQEERNVNIRISGQRKRKIEKLRKDIKKRDLKIKEFSKRIKQLEDEVNVLTDEISKIKNSKSWRYTSIFRRN